MRASDRLTRMSWQNEFDARTAFGRPGQLKPGRQPLRSLAHDVKTDVPFVEEAHVVGIVAQAVVLDQETELTIVDDRHIHVTRLRMLAHVRERFLKNENHLQLMIRRERRPARLAIAQRHRYAGLRTKALDGAFHRVPELALAELRTEVVEQLAHVFVTFCDTAFEQRHDLANFVDAFFARGGIEQMQLHFQEVEALRDAVVQSLRDEVAFLRYREG